MVANIFFVSNYFNEKAKNLLRKQNSLLNLLLLSGQESSFFDAIN